MTVGRVADGVEVRLTDAAGRPIEDAAVHVAVPGGLDDPGECDAVGPDRCSHPGGRYRTRTGEVGRSVTVEIDGPLGADSVEVPVRQP